MSFYSRVERVPLMDALSNRFFSHIAGLINFGRDKTFTATLRAYLSRRLGPEDMLCLVSNGEALTRQSVESHNASTIIDTYVGIDIDHASNTLVLCYDTGESGVNGEAARVFDENFVHLHPGFSEKEDLKAFLAQKEINIRVYINNETQVSIVFVDKMDIGKYHAIQTLVSRFVPWFNSPDKPIDEDEKALFASLCQKDPDVYLAAMSRIAAKIDMNAFAVDMYLKDFEKQIRTTELENANDELRYAENEANQYIGKYRNCVRKIDDIRVRIYGLKYIIEHDDGSGELVSLFKRSPLLEIVETDGSTIKFIVKGYLSMFDAEEYSIIAKNRNSFVHTIEGEGVFSDDKNRQLLLDAIFSEDPVLKVKMCAYFELDTRGAVSSLIDYRFPASCNDMLANPHLNHHNCLGQHRALILDRLREHDVTGAIMQCIASAQSMHVGEQASSGYFIEELYDSHQKCIETMDGQTMTPTEAVEYLIARSEHEA